MNIISKEQCTGCAACASVCPKACIKMLPDKEGFLFPEIDETACIHCNRCQNVCPVANGTRQNPAANVAFACKSTNEAERANSSSGGIFVLLAKAVLKKDGVVYGAALSDDCKSVFHQRVEREEDLAALQGSKYVQSRIGETYRQVKKDLTDSKTVYFSGTPCQVAGLYAYLGREYGNLYTQDLICHGVPSPLVWEKYLRHLELCGNTEPQQASFRDKSEGWHKFSMKVSFGNGNSIREPLDKNAYLNVFLNNLCLRPSCHACSFKGAERAADLTLGDFWGIEKAFPEQDDDKGVSIVFANSEKGESLFRQIEDQLILWEVDPTLAVSENPAMYASVKSNPKRTDFMKAIQKRSFQNALDAVWKPPFSERLKEMCKKPFRKIKYLIFKK